MEKIPTGIRGLDEMVSGGLPIPSIILLAGESGTGKTTFCMQFLCKGAEMQERGIYFMALRESPVTLMRHISSFEFVNTTDFCSRIRCVDLNQVLEEGEPDEVLKVVVTEVKEFRPRRVVLDSLPFLETLMGGDEYKRFLFKLASQIRSWEGTTLITAEAHPEVPYPLDIAYISDGVILLYNKETGSTRQRSLEILKMMGTCHRLGKHAVEISSRGFVVYPGF